MWYLRTNLISLVFVLSAVIFMVGANTGLQADSHAEIDREFASAVSDTDANDIPSEKPAPYKRLLKFLPADRETTASLAMPVVKTALTYGAKPVAHVVYSLAFVPVLVWQFISLLPIAGAFLYSGRQLRRGIYHG